MRLLSDSKYEFIEKRRTAYRLSAVVIVVGLLAMAWNLVSTGSWLNYGIDFTGGTLVQVRFDQPVDPGDIRDALGGASAPAVTSFGEGDEYVIRAPLAEGVGVEAVRDGIEGQLAGEFGAGTFEIVRTELVGPTIGEELQRKAVLAVLMSFGLTLIYLAFRFEFRFGLAAVIATMHDIVITLGFLALFRMEIGLPTIAAILTVVGSSLNDTIVVFDRIRENLHAKGARKENQAALINRSINETLPRTVMTGMSVLGTLLALLLVGPPTLRDFSLVLVLGLVVGTYSSIFIASPALLEIEKRMGAKEPTRTKRRPETASV